MDKIKLNKIAKYLEGKSGIALALACRNIHSDQLPTNVKVALRENVLYQYIYCNNYVNLTSVLPLLYSNVWKECNSDLLLAEIIRVEFKHKDISNVFEMYKPFLESKLFDVSYINLHENPFNHAIDIDVINYLRSQTNQGNLGSEDLFNLIIENCDYKTIGSIVFPDNLVDKAFKVLVKRKNIKNSKWVLSSLRFMYLNVGAWSKDLETKYVNLLYKIKQNKICGLLHNCSLLNLAFKDKLVQHFSSESRTLFVLQGGNEESFF